MMAERRRHGEDNGLQVAPLRLLSSALAVFVAARGTRLAALDLGGLPLGRELPSLLAPLVAAMQGVGTSAIRWLGLSACRLRDKGLAMLMPWLAGADNALPQLDALDLSWNLLRDVRLVDALLRARARLCFERRSGPLRLLDLSGNSHLCDPASPVAPPAQRSVVSVGVRRGPQRCALARSIAAALVAGLPLQVLRLQRLGADEAAIQPLLQVLHEEVRRCSASGGLLASSSGFRLVELDLAGNPLACGFIEALESSLELLRSLRELPPAWQQPPQDAHACSLVGSPRALAPHGAEAAAGETEALCLGDSVCAAEPPDQAAPLQKLVGLRAASEPPPRIGRHERSAMSVADVAGVGAAACATALDGLEGSIGDGDADERNAISDAEWELSAAKSRQQEKSRDDGSAVDSLRRACERRELRLAAERLAGRRPRKKSLRPALLPSQAPFASQSNVELSHLQSWAEPEIAIASVCGPAAAKSLVRQAVFAELLAASFEDGSRGVTSDFGADNGTHLLTSLAATRPFSEAPLTAALARPGVQQAQSHRAAIVASAVERSARGGSSAAAEERADLRAHDVPSHAAADDCDRAADSAPMATEEVIGHIQEDQDMQLFRATLLESLRVDLLGSKEDEQEACASEAVGEPAHRDDHPCAARRRNAAGGRPDAATTAPAAAAASRHSTLLDDLRADALLAIFDRSFAEASMA
eukprot:TRINITY_DN28944_c0_g1_i1.p1 TRINITY_DN28944_c0_g1~~TRINITY_DN28944_c0_g1_i1.p1  ORF type:complete len:802 (+),score=190.92 TRINITY_DN28944_c0_g1_i1:299-2407(+)